jgi:hypothetical protein
VSEDERPLHLDVETVGGVPFIVAWPPTPGPRPRPLQVTVAWGDGDADPFEFWWTCYDPMTYQNRALWLDIPVGVREVTVAIDGFAGRIPNIAEVVIAREQAGVLEEPPSKRQSPPPEPRDYSRELAHIATQLARRNATRPMREQRPPTMWTRLRRRVASWL